MSVVYLVLLASLADVERSSAVKAIVLVARRTVEFFVALFKHEAIRAAWCRAPRHIGLFVDCQVQGPFLKFGVHILRQNGSYIIVAAGHLTIDIWALERKQGFIDLRLEVLANAIGMEYVFTGLEWEHLLPFIVLHHAYGASLLFNFIGLPLLEESLVIVLNFFDEFTSLLVGLIHLIIFLILFLKLFDELSRGGIHL